MGKYMKVFNHGDSRWSRRYSINETDEEGRFVKKVAFWFVTFQSAQFRAEGLVAEDAADGQLSILLDGCGKI